MDERFYRGLLDLLYDGVYFVDKNRTITFWNKAAKRITGYGPEEVIGSSCRDNLLMHVNGGGVELCLGHCPLAATMEDGEVREVDVYLHHKAGHRVPISVRATPLLDERGEVAGAVEVFTDNTERLDMHEMLERYEREALLDQLTGVGNRRFADMRLATVLDEFKRHKAPFGFLFVDIDHFKRVNDNYGHAVGDKALSMVAKTMESALRPMDVVCRFGGEEFVVILPNMEPEAFRRVAERLRVLIENSWLHTDQGPLTVTASVGGTLARPGDTAEDLIQRADERMYFCKQHGRNQVSLG